MARPRIRHYRGVPFNYFRGSPPESLRPGSYRWDETKTGYWVSHAYLKILKQRAREERRAARLLNRTRFGEGSGRAGGGRGAAHKIFHRAAVNNDTLSADCPICLHRKLWILWLTSDCGRWTDKWEAWPETELLRRELKQLDYKQRRSLMRDPGDLHLMKIDLVKRYPAKIEELKEMQQVVGLFFDRYMRTHRFEHKYIASSRLARLTGSTADVQDPCIFVHLGLFFEYQPVSTHEGAISTEFCSDQKVASTKRPAAGHFHRIHCSASHSLNSCHRTKSRRRKVCLLLSPGL